MWNPFSRRRWVVERITKLTAKIAHGNQDIIPMYIFASQSYQCIHFMLLDGMAISKFYLEILPSTLLSAGVIFLGDNISCIRKIL